MLLQSGQHSEDIACEHVVTLDEISPSAKPLGWPCQCLKYWNVSAGLQQAGLASHCPGG